jgi:uncharacterized protein (TIRG00374 family)
MRKFIILLILFLAVLFVFLSFSELQNIAETLQQSNWIFLTFAILFECLWFYNFAITFGSLYRLLELEETRGRLLLMATARQRDQPTGRVTVVGVLFVLYDYAAFLCVLTLGLVVLFRRNHLTAGELSATAILMLIALAMASLLYLGYKSSERLGKVLAWMARLVNRVVRPFIHREYLKEENAHAFARDAAEGIAIIRSKRKALLWPFLFALNNKALLICVLAFTFLALGTPFSVGTLVGGFSIAYLFLIVSPTPSGVGVVESILPVALNSLRVQWAAAVLITLVYRAVTFWFPLLVGAVAFRILNRKPQKQPALDKTE